MPQVGTSLRDYTSNGVRRRGAKRPPVPQVTTVRDVTCLWSAAYSNACCSYVLTLYDGDMAILDLPTRGSLVISDAIVGAFELR